MLRRGENEIINRMCHPAYLRVKKAYLHSQLMLVAEEAAAFTARLGAAVAILAFVLLYISR